MYKLFSITKRSTIVCFFCRYNINVRTSTAQYTVIACDQVHIAKYIRIYNDASVLSGRL